MPQWDTDFLNVGDAGFDSLDEVTSHISENVDLEELSGDLSIIGSLSNFRTPEEFRESISSHFNVELSAENIFLLNARYADVPYFVFLSDEGEEGLFPIFFTSGRKTKDIPKTIDEYFKQELDIGRLWISKTEMEDLRQRISDSYDNILMPYFTATRSKHSETPARFRPRYDRTIQYYGDDGLATFEQMKYDYGVLPTNLKFQKANKFKFRVTTRGTFTIKNGGLDEVLSVIGDSINRLRDVKRAIDTSDFTTQPNKYARGRNLPQSRPWAVKLSNELDGDDIRRFRREELSEDWEFTLASLKEPDESDSSRFQATLIDERTPGKTVLRSWGPSLRIYPRKRTGVDQSIRIFEFINDQIDPEADATIVS